MLTRNDPAQGRAATSRTPDRTRAEQFNRFGRLPDSMRTALGMLAASHSLLMLKLENRTVDLDAIEVFADRCEDVAGRLRAEVRRVRHSPTLGAMRARADEVRASEH